MIQTKISKLRERWAKGDKAGALKIAAKFPSLGAEKDVIELGAGCLSSPGFYAQLGIETGQAIEAAYSALVLKYSL